MKTWHASLALQFRQRNGRTTLTQRHRGPLQVQKPLYPEGSDVCHTIIIHPPGGIAGGDALSIEIDTDAGSHALITTPGATKWYKSNGRQASQRVVLRVGGALEWLPQETIVFDQADVQSSIEIHLADSAAMLGWDVVALGRSAGGERFDVGRFAQTIRLHAGEQLEWVERTRIVGGDALMQSPIGLTNRPVFGCMWAAGPIWRAAQIEKLRERLPSDGAALTQLSPRLLVARALGANTLSVRRAFEAAWHELRPLVFGGRDATQPRIWAT